MQRHDAFLEQAKSDWKTYEVIQNGALDACADVGSTIAQPFAARKGNGKISASTRP
ncbi:MAG: hypothetical protein ONB43_10665 [candidate division KSB1 bacterium]|nr:hypothetical protein [candidate division KSB1 bacterium]